MLGLMLSIYLKNRRNWVGWALLVAVSTLGFYAMPLMFYPFGIVIIWLLLTAIGQESLSKKLAFGRSALLCGALVVVCTVALYSPILVAVPERESGLGAFAVSGSGPYWTNLFMAWEQWNRSVPVPLMYLLVAGVLLAIVFHRRMSDHVSVALPVVLWCAAVIFFQRWIPFARQWQFLLPIYAILSAAGLVYLYERASFLKKNGQLFAIGVLVLSAALCLNLTRTQTPTHSRTPIAYIEDLCHYLGEHLRPGQKVVPHRMSPTQYYFRRLGMDLDSLVSRSTEDPWADSAGVRSVYVVISTAGRVEYSPSAPVESVDWLSDVWDVNSARLVRSYDTALLYELQRRSR
jgi:hypothetical protein